MFFKTKARTLVSPELTLDERKYALDFITKKIRFFDQERFYSYGSLAHEESKHFLPRNAVRMHYEEQNVQGYDEILNRLKTMKEKLKLMELLNQEDLAELNDLLDKKRYRVRLAWYRI